MRHIFAFCLSGDFEARDFRFDFARTSRIFRRFQVLGNAAILDGTPLRQPQ